MVILYSPLGSPTWLNSPSELALRFLVPLVLTFMMITDADGIFIPCASATVPLIVPVVDSCAKHRVAVNRTIVATSTKFRAK